MKLQDSLSIAKMRVEQTHIPHAVIKMHCGECDIVLPQNYKGEYIYKVSYEKDQLTVKDYQGNIVEPIIIVEASNKKGKANNKPEKIQDIPELLNTSSTEILSGDEQSGSEISSDNK